MADDWFNTQNYAKEAGILAGVESFLRGLPQEVRTKLTAGEIADVALGMIDRLRKEGKHD